MADLSLTDSHAHLDSTDFAGRVGEVLARARAAGVTRVLTVPSRRESCEETVRLAEEHDDAWAAVGVHPHEAAQFEAADEERLARLARSPRVVAIGEIGLDYHYDRSPRDVQRDVFRRQLRLAARAGLPVVVHARDADDDTASILEDEGASGVGGVLHCFTAGPRLAERSLALGLLVSFSGIVTFKNAGALREIAREVPADSLLVETDAPYLAPEPGRKWPNEPANVRVTADYLASLRGTSLADLAATTSANFERVFLA